jgi:hypothetical protein
MHKITRLDTPIVAKNGFHVQQCQWKETSLVISNDLISFLDEFITRFDVQKRGNLPKTY